MIIDEAGLREAAKDPVDVVIIGGGPAGLACARGYRDAGGAGSVIMISAEDWPPYHRPPLTKDYLRGDVEADALAMIDDDWYADHDVTLALGTTVDGLDRDGHVVVTSTGVRIGYRTVVLATGSAPTPLPIDGGDLPGLIYVRDRDSAEQMARWRGADHRVAVIGSGFVGCEAAASLARTGTRVTMISDESVPHERRLGAEAGTIIAGWLRDAGVELRTGDAAAGIAVSDDQWVITSTDGTAVTVDAVVAGGGARPRVELAEGSGLALRDGGVAVTSSMRTTDPAVWAVGDIASAVNDAAGRSLRVEHWGEAETMGEIAGRALAGDPGAWDQPPGFWSEIGDHTVKYTAWGDGFDASHLARTDEGWAVLYGREGTLVGVLTSEWDDVYDEGQRLLAAGTAFAAAVRDLLEP